MSIFTRRGRAIALSLLLLCVAPLSASAVVVELPEERVIASVIYDADEDRYLSPGMVTVIRLEERVGEQRTLPELLEDVPGLRVISLRGRHGYSVASVRGSTSAQVAVYVDGVLMNLHGEAAVDLSAIPIDNIERIEVYRGFVPARFGAQAMGGVINIITRLPAEPQTSVSLSAGSFGRYRGILSHSAMLGDGRFFGSLGYETYDGNFRYWNDAGTPFNLDDDYTARRRGNSFENTDLLLRWENDDWRVRASWIRRNRELALPAPGLDRPGVPQRPSALLDTRRTDLSLGRSHTSGVVNWEWDVGYTAQNQRYNSRRGNALSAIGGMAVTSSEYATSRLAASLRANMPLGERHFLEMRAGYSHERLNIRGDMVYQYLGGIDRYSMADWHVILQNTTALDAAGAFLFTPSLRWHQVDGEGRFTWQAALSKEFANNWMIKATYGTYARAPNMFERYGDGAFILPAPGDMHWETGTQFDVGIMWNGTVEALGNARTRTSLSAFWRDTDNLIEFLMTSPRFARFDNIARAEVRGVELETALDWERWSLSLHGTWMDGTNRTPDAGTARYYGMALPNRPTWSGGTRLTRRFERGSMFAEYVYIGANYVDSLERVLFDARHTFNIGLHYDLSQTTRLSVGVNDVFNSANNWRMRPDGQHGPVRMLWHPIEGRSFYMTLRMMF